MSTPSNQQPIDDQATGTATAPIADLRDPSAPGPESWVFGDCPLCGQTIPDQPMAQVADRDGQPVWVRACRTCRTLFASGTNIVTDAEAETARQADYHVGVWEDLNVERLDLLASEAATLAWELAERLPAPAEAGAVIDVGAGRGNILHALRRIGHDVRGCEPAPGLCQLARTAYLLGPDVLANTDAGTYLDQLEADGTEVSAFILWHVLEHLRDPLGLLRRCLEVSPRALLFLELPVAMPKDIYSEHLFFPTPSSLVHLARELGAEVEMLEVIGDHRLRFYLRGRADEAVDLEAEARRVDLARAEAAYRSLSPAYDLAFPAAAGSTAEPAAGQAAASRSGDATGVPSSRPGR